MLNTFKNLLVHQYEAEFCTLKICMDRCPETAWNSPVGNLAFCQVVFHTLFYADYYLGQNEESLQRQQFHQDHESFFRDYEELQDRQQKFLYDKPTTESYLNHCRSKTIDVLATETEESFKAATEFERRDFSRAELHVYNIRHIQHHAAQLSLRLRLDTGEGIPWIGTGWQDI